MRRLGLHSVHPGICLAVLCALAGAGSAAFAATVTPGIWVESRYDDNIEQQPRGLRDIATLIRPELRLGERDQTTRWELRAHRSFITYSLQPALSPQSDLVSAALSRAPSEASSMAIDYRYTRSRDPLNLDPLASPSRGSLSWSRAGMRGELWRGEAALRFNRWAYSESDLRDGESRSWEVSAFPIRSREGKWLATYSGNDLRIGGESVLGSHVGLFGWRRSHSVHLRSQVQLGVAAVDPKDGTGASPELAALVDVVGSLSPFGSPTGVHLRFAHDIESTAGVEVTQGRPFFSASAGWERALDVEGGIYRDPTLTERWTMGVADTLSGKVLAARGSYGRTRPLRAGGTRAKVIRASVSLTIPLFDWLSQQTLYDFVQQGGLDSGQAVDFRRSRIGVALLATLR